jgi:hypothetical protein
MVALNPVEEEPPTWLYSLHVLFVSKISRDNTD